MSGKKIDCSLHTALHTLKNYGRVVSKNNANSYNGHFCLAGKSMK